MTVWLVVIVGLVLCLLLVRGVKGPAHTVETLGPRILGLLRQGYDGGFLIIKVARSKKFIQLSKYINSPGDYGIELAFPRAAWSTEYFERLRARCDAEEEVRYRVSRGGGDNDPLDFLYVDFGKDHVKATEFVQRVLTEILDVPKGARLYTRLENATPLDELVEA